MKFRNDFFILVDDVCKELGYPPRPSRPESDEVVAMEMELDGYPFAVVHSLVTASDRILIECRFGVLPEENREAILYRLLHLNYALADAGASVFCFDSELNQILYTNNCELTTQSGQSLLGAMTQMSWQARQWNESYFLEAKANPTSAGFPAEFGALA
ncbi:CesT family type III secretion system chaperone [Lacisediminimonas sp.]|uniref:CesT family type III secretion system chaperone n=1 Tax=Lacisediminimonas sp. TaxID=3060582 RepID=UPI002725F758|nr:CesT family type III secretion system chaperone [Lacisediminimonas sp.]MDO8301081.1 CesT family type III secretion system chaperone [Lacisediminimonas sp.]